MDDAHLADTPTPLRQNFFLVIFFLAFLFFLGSFALNMKQWDSVGLRDI